MIEENLTSVTAQESMGRVRVRDIKQRLDSESARVILENAIAIIKRA
jgi:RNase H-fold protein (predicted Holliday junction resolvase)